MTKQASKASIVFRGFLLVIALVFTAIIFLFLSESLFIWSMSGNAGNPIMLFLDVKSCEYHGGHWNYTLGECADISSE